MVLFRPRITGCFTSYPCALVSHVLQEVACVTRWACRSSPSAAESQEPLMRDTHSA